MHRCVQRASLPEQPVVPPETPDREGRNRRIQAARERKVVDAAGDLKLAFAAGMGCGAALPSPVAGQSRLGCRRRRGGPPSGICSRCASDSRQGRGEIVEQNDVGVDVTKNLAPAEFFCLVEEIADQGRAPLIALHVGNVPKPELCGDFSGARFGAEQDDFRLRCSSASSSGWHCAESRRCVPRIFWGRENGQRVAAASLGTRELMRSPRPYPARGNVRPAHRARNFTDRQQSMTVRGFSFTSARPLRGSDRH